MRDATEDRARRGGSAHDAQPGRGDPFAVSEHDGRVRLTLTGNVDIRSAHALHAVVTALAGRDLPVDVDAGGATRLDASAVQLVLALARSVRDAGHAFTLACADPARRRTLVLAGLGPHLHAQDDGAPAGNPPPGAAR